jgi:hypothetical protein
MSMPTGHGSTGSPENWAAVLRQRLPLYGHRNFIAIVDSAYPAQSRPGIETIATGASQIAVVRETLADLGRARHVRPRIYVDRELEFVAEADAPGIGKYRDELRYTLEGLPVDSLPHEQIIARLDKAAQLFNVLILKTDLALPYTSVFVELECGYWTDDAEKRLRQAMPSTMP